MADQGLCYVCETIEFEEIFLHGDKRWAEEKDYDQGYEVEPLPRLSIDAICLGMLSDVELRAETCVFCQLVMKPEVQIRRKNHHPLSLDSQVFITGRHVSFVSTNSGMMPLWGRGIYVLLTNQGDDEPITRESLEMTREGLETTIQLLEHPAFEETRVIEDLVDFDRLRSYLSSCHCETESTENERGSHDDILPSPNGDADHDVAVSSMSAGKDPVPSAENPRAHAATGTIPGRLIDVWDRIVVAAPSEVEYVTLSYVWGAGVERTYQLSSQAVIQANGKDGVPLAARLPQTIEDAIALTVHLGFQYLWVDGLCIIQDDPEDKGTEIKGMHTTFQNAAMCIVSASGNSVHSGIAGCTPGLRQSRQDVKRCKDIALGLANPPVGELLTSNVWYTRGWTFQEMMLSKRCLFFTEAEVFFKCPEFVYRESTTTEQSAMGHHSFPALTAFERPIEAYMYCVERYSARTLSDKADILNGFTGLLLSLRRDLNEPICYGMPTGDGLLAGLLWAPKTQLGVRRSTGSIHEPLFPSWSWAGWEGAIDYGLVLDTSNRFEGVKSMLQLDEIKQLDPLSDLSYASDPTAAPAEPNSRNEATFTGGSPSPGPSTRHGTGVVLSLMVTILPFEVCCGENSKFKDEIRNSSGERVGHCVIHYQVDDTQRLEVILLATGVRKSGMVDGRNSAGSWCYVMVVHSNAQFRFRCGLGQITEASIAGIEIDQRKILLG